MKAVVLRLHSMYGGKGCAPATAKLVWRVRVNGEITAMSNSCGNSGRT